MAAGIWIKMDSRHDETAQKPAPPPKSDRPVWLSPEVTRRANSLAWQYGFPLVVCTSLFVLLIATIEFFRQPTPAIVDVIWGINS